MTQVEMFDVVQEPKKRRGRRKKIKGKLAVMISRPSKLGLYAGIELFNWKLIVEKSEFSAGVQVGPLIIVVAW